MKRYALFGWGDWSASGGFEDFVFAADTIDECKAAFKADGGHIVDLETMKIVLHADKRFVDCVTEVEDAGKPAILRSKFNDLSEKARALLVSQGVVVVEEELRRTIEWVAAK